jgi:hypothetical protein
MRSLLLTTMFLATVGALAAPATATTILSDNFDDTGSTLAGQAADTGQIWAEITTWGGIASPLDVGSAYGVGGTNGAGKTSFGSYSEWGNSVSLGGTLSAGLVNLQIDCINNNASGYTVNQYYLWDSVRSKGLTLQWMHNPYHTPATGVGLEGLGITESMSFPPHDPGYNTGVMHMSLNVDLTAKTVSYSWYDVNDPANVSHQGAVNVGPYSQDFTPDTFLMYVGKWSGSGAGGFDNLSVTIPEPATLTSLLGAALGLVCYAWRRRRT